MDPSQLIRLDVETPSDDDNNDENVNFNNEPLTHLSIYKYISTEEARIRVHRFVLLCWISFFTA